MLALLFRGDKEPEARMPKIPKGEGWKKIADLSSLVLMLPSSIAVGLFIGYLILGSFSRVESRGMLIGALALGFAILTLIKLIPYLGIPLWLATVLFGLGAMAMSQKTLKEGVTKLETVPAEE